MMRPTEPEVRKNPGQTPSVDTEKTLSSLVGSVLRDRYVIEARLGVGGNASVFRALDRYRATLPVAQQYVAVKVLQAGGETRDASIGDPQRELHYGQALSHRNIVNVFELDRDGDIVFFTMEYLDGVLLADVLGRLRAAPLQRTQAWQIIRQLGAGLEHSHERGVVHGDLSPRNILITRQGELRILNFGAERKNVRAHTADSGSRPAAVPKMSAYASCEQLDGRTPDPRDDVYALACISYELLSGTHPFASRPATQARDFAVKATRPTGLGGRQWRTLQAGLAWHRAGRAISVHKWLARLTEDAPVNLALTPPQDLKPAAAGKPLWQTRAAAACVAAMLVSVVCISQLRESSTATANADDSATARPTAKSEGAAPSTSASLANTSPGIAPLANLPRPTAAAARAVVTATPAKLTVRPTPAVAAATISVDGYHVSSDEHFVEIQVRRSQLQKNASFSWWTEPATARQDVDYVHQAKAIQTFPSDRRSTRFYVKLLPESVRSGRDYFYVAIAPSGHDRLADKVTRVQIWLPTSRDPLQARR